MFIICKLHIKTTNSMILRHQKDKSLKIEIVNISGC